MKKILFALVLLVVEMFSLCFLACSNNNIVKYVYTSKEGEVSYFEIDFNANKYKYEGNGFYSESLEYMLRPGTSYSVESTIYYVKTVNNMKVYNFHDHPWNYEYTFSISEDEKTLYAINNDTYGYIKYEFIKDGTSSSQNNNETPNNENAEQEGDNSQNDEQQPERLGCYKHKDLQLDQYCAYCNKQCYVKIGADVLTYDQSSGELTAEFYGDVATNVFKVYNGQLTEIYVSDSVTSIHEGAFYNCDNLKTVTFEENSRLESIGSRAFLACYMLENIKIPNSVTSIGDYAFSSCSNLSVDSIGNNLKIVGCNAFNNIKLWDDAQDNSVVYLDNVCLGVKGNLPINTHVQIKEGTLTIADNSFTSQGGLRGITFPQSLKNIGRQAFYNCPALITVNSGGNVDYVWSGGGDHPQHAFTGTPFEETALNNGDFYFDKVLLKADKSIAEYVIKEGTVMISCGAFKDYDKLTSVKLPNSVTSIGDYAFSHCGLTSIEIPDNVVSVGYRAFYYCNDLESIKIPKSLNSLSAGGVSSVSNFRVYYAGSEKEWDEVKSNFSGLHFNSATMYYYSEFEPALNGDGTAYDGNYWKYDENGEIVVWEYTQN